MNPSDLDFAKLIAELDARIKNLERTPQPFLGDWFEVLNPIEYVSADTLKFSDDDLDPRSFFTVGDKVRYKQGGDYKYAYIKKISATQWEVFSGTDYTLNNASVTDFAKGVTATPTGHPILFNFNPNILGLSATYTNLNPASFENAKFLMIGKLLKMKLDVTFGNLSGNSVLRATPPIPSDFTTYERQIMSCTDSTGFKAGLAKMGGPNIIEIYSSATLGSFNTSTSNELGFNISLEYTVEN